jgi:hypothetical protein
MKIAIFVVSDPKAGEEALGRVFNALALARESLLADNAVAGTPGLASIRGAIAEGRTTLVF